MSSRSARLYVHAVRAARPRQLIGRARAPLTRRLTRVSGHPPPLRPVDGAAGLWRSEAFANVDARAAEIAAGRLGVLGAVVPYPPTDWRRPGFRERLRCFHLHYGDEALAAARDGSTAAIDAARAGIDNWIAANPPGSDPGWHPYPLSTRAANWIAAETLTPGLLDGAAVGSLWRQLRYLGRNIEDGVLGNHVVRNALALGLGGAAFGDDRLRRRAESLLRRELPEQLLPDGGHYERSPVYHLVVLRDLLTLRTALDLEELEPYLDRMRRFAAALARPDGRAAVFNDGAADLTPALPTSPATDGLHVFRETGYVVVRNARIWLAFDCGAPSPSFLPAHAHADALSFQLWVGGLPVVVDPGTSTYEPGETRDRERGTFGHSTIRVDGRDQFLLWGAFRSGPLPRVALESVEGDGAAGSVTAAVHLPEARVVHRRRLAWSRERVVVEDTVEGAGSRSLEATLTVPAVAVEGGLTRVNGCSILSDGTVTAADWTTAEAFFAPVRATVLIGTLDGRLPLRHRWTIELPPEPSETHT